jgi:hypothetical protein
VIGTLKQKVKTNAFAKMMSTVSSYKSKFELMITDLTNNNLTCRTIGKNILILLFRQRRM